MAREFDARVASRGRSSAWLLNQTDAASGILRDYSCSFIFGSIIDDQQFGRRFGLLEYAADGILDISFTVAHRNDYAYLHPSLRRRSRVCLTTRSTAPRHCCARAALYVVLFPCSRLCTSTSSITFIFNPTWRARAYHSVSSACRKERPK